MVKSTIETITPEQAAGYLLRNSPVQRKLSIAAVRYLAAQIVRGEWVLTHQGIAFDEDGYIIDGQHRLAAIAMAERPVEMMVSRGMPSSTFRAIDHGVGRTNAVRFGVAPAVMTPLVLAAKLAFCESGGSQKPTDGQIEQAQAAYGDAVQALVDANPVNRPNISTGPVKLGAATIMVETPDYADDVIRLYAALVEMKLEDVTRSLQMFASVALARRFPKHGKTNHWALATSMRAFDPSTKSTTIPRTSMEMIKAATQRVRMVVLTHPLAPTADQTVMDVGDGSQ